MNDRVTAVDLHFTELHEGNKPTIVFIKQNENILWGHGLYITFHSFLVCKHLLTQNLLL